MSFMPASVRYDTTIGDRAKLLYIEVTANVDNMGICRQDKIYFADMFDLTERGVSLVFADLIKAGHLAVHEEEGEKFVRLTGGYQPTEITVKRKPELRKVTKEETYPIIDKWNEQHGTKYKSTGVIVQHIKARLLTFTQEEILKAFDNRFAHVSTDSWWNKEENHRHKINIDPMIRNDKRIQEWLNRGGGDVKKAPAFKPIQFN